MQRHRSQPTLENSPLSLVLCQVRFTPVMAMGKYVPDIQDELRRSGFPIHEPTQILEAQLGPQGPRASARPRWEFLAKDRRTSVVVDCGFMVLQTTAYDGFENYVGSLLRVIETVAGVVQGILVQRIGLRYVNAIVPQPGESWQQYVQSGLHGFESPLFAEGTAVRLHQTVARTNVGTMIVRLFHRLDGQTLPPDLAESALALRHAERSGQANGPATLLDIDHYHESEPEEFNRSAIENVAWDLKEGSYSVFANNVATAHAMEAWR